MTRPWGELECERSSLLASLLAWSLSAEQEQTIYDFARSLQEPIRRGDADVQAGVVSQIY